MGRFPVVIGAAVALGGRRRGGVGDASGWQGGAGWRRGTPDICGPGCARSTGGQSRSGFASRRFGPGREVSRRYRTHPNTNEPTERFTMRNPLLSVTLLALPLLGGAFGQSRPPAGDWPQFRGPDGLATSTCAKLPLTWSATQNLAWKTQLPGPGTSSPIVVGDRVFLTCYTGYGPAALTHDPT